MALTLVACLAAACGSTTDSGNQAIDEPAINIAQPAPTSEVAPAPTAAVKPTESAVPTETVPTENVPTETVPVETIEPEPEPEVATVEIDPTTVLGVTADARYGYAAARNAWFDPVPCDSQPAETLVGVDVVSSTPESIVLFQAGFEVAGNVERMIFSPEGRGAALLSCGDETTAPWLQIVDFDGNGRVASVGPVISLPQSDVGSRPRPSRWIDEGSVGFYVYGENSLSELAISAAAGEELGARDINFEDDFGLPNQMWTTTPDGQFSYRQVDDPEGRPGCEGTGFEVTIALDDGSGERPAMNDPDQVFPSISDLHFGPNNLISWTSWCEGFPFPYVGRILADGMIVDVHPIYVSAIAGRPDSSTEFRDFRLAADGSLVAVGTRYESGTDPEIALIKYDLASDPKFIVTGSAAPTIDLERRMAHALSGGGYWYVGESTASEPACGASTLYRDTPDGLRGGLGIEIDRVIDFDAGEAVEIHDRGEGGERIFVSTRRFVVLSTECPEEYEGLQLWFGTERDPMRGGLSIEPLASTGVREVLSLREEYRGEGAARLVVIVNLLLDDGTLGEIEVAP